MEEGNGAAPKENQASRHTRYLTWFGRSWQSGCQVEGNVHSCRCAEGPYLMKGMRGWVGRASKDSEGLSRQRRGRDQRSQSPSSLHQGRNPGVKSTCTEEVQRGGQCLRSRLSCGSGIWKEGESGACCPLEAERRYWEGDRSAGEGGRGLCRLPVGCPCPSGPQ